MTNNKQNQKEISLKDIHNDLKELLKWTKFAGIKEIKPTLETQLANDSDKLIYHHSDGTKGTKEIAKIVGGVSYTTVFVRWKSWEKSGLGESISVAGGNRFKRSFDLEDFGIKIPQIALEQENQQTEITLQPKEDEVSVN